MPMYLVLRHNQQFCDPQLQHQALHQDCEFCSKLFQVLPFYKYLQITYLDPEGCTHGVSSESIIIYMGQIAETHDFDGYWRHVRNAVQYGSTRSIELENPKWKYLEPYKKSSNQQYSYLWFKTTKIKAPEEFGCGWDQQPIYILFYFQC